MYICDGLVLNLPPENKPWNVVQQLRNEAENTLFYKNKYYMFFKNLSDIGTEEEFLEFRDNFHLLINLAVCIVIGFSFSIFLAFLIANALGL